MNIPADDYVTRIELKEELRLFGADLSARLSKQIVSDISDVIAQLAQSMHDELQVVKTDIKAVKKDVSVLKRDVNRLRYGFQDLKTTLSTRTIIDL